MDKRKRYTAEEKINILRAVLEEGKNISVVASENGLHPNNIFNWKKQLFEGAVSVFSQKRSDISAKADEKRTVALEEKLAQKDEVIAELASELLALKKKSSGLILGERR